MKLLKCLYRLEQICSKCCSEASQWSLLWHDTSQKCKQRPTSLATAQLRCWRLWWNSQKNLHTDEVLELQPAVNRHQEMPHVLFWHPAPWVSLSALWFLGPLPFNTHTENCVSLEIYIPFWSWPQPFSTTYRQISSFHSNGALLSLGTGRKRVIVSVDGWSRLRTQHTSPDLDHWPAKRRARRQQPAGNRTVMIRACGKPSDLYTESPWAAGGVVVSPTQSAGRTSILPIDDQRRPGSGEKK